MDNATLFDRLSSLSDPTRCRILRLLDRHELTVTELCRIVQLPQSTVSRHLKALADAGWIERRAEATSNLYAMSQGNLDPAARRLWLVVREQLESAPAASQDLRRLETVLAQRQTKSQEFFASSAGQWDRMRDELFGDRFHLAALAGFADRSWIVGDLGCGTGRVASALAPFVRQVIAVDGSAAMLKAARTRLRDLENVELRRGHLETVPINDGQLDAATLMLVLHHVAEPTRALAEVARVVKPGGRVVMVDMLPHDRENYRHQMGHVWLGFSADQTRRLLADEGFEHVRIVALPPDALAKGPALFVATARKQSASAAHRREASSRAAGNAAIEEMPWQP